MIVVMQPRASEAQIQHVIDRLIELGFDVHRSTGEEVTVLGALGVRKEFDTTEIEILDGVREVIRISQPYKLASRAFRSEGTVVDLGGGVRLGGSGVVVIAGPDAVKSAAQIDGIAEIIARAGIRVLHAGAIRPRRPAHDFEGMGERGLRLLREAADRHRLRVVGEVRSLTDIPMLVDFADMIQVGDRNMQNDDLLDALGALRKPVLVERAPGATIEEFLLAAEHILSGGNYQVVLCERGIRTFETVSHNTLDISAIPAVKRLSHLPFVVDPSRVASRLDQVAPIARAAVAAGADGLLIEIHHDPEHGLADRAQSLPIDQFEHLIGELRKIASAVGRSLA